jgi:hypothetical protein
VVGVGSIVKRLSAAAIPRVTIGSVPDEEFRERTPKRGGCHVERRVAGIKVVGDFFEKEVCRVFACSANFSLRRGQNRIGRQAAGHFFDVAIYDKSNEIKKVGFDLGHRVLVR